MKAGHVSVRLAPTPSIELKELRPELLEVMRATDDALRVQEAKALFEFVSGAEGPHTYVKFIGD